MKSINIRLSAPAGGTVTLDSPNVLGALNRRNAKREAEDAGDGIHLSVAVVYLALVETKLRVWTVIEHSKGLKSVQIVLGGDQPLFLGAGESPATQKADSGVPVLSCRIIAKPLFDSASRAVNRPVFLCWNWLHKCALKEHDFTGC